MAKAGYMKFFAVWLFVRLEVGRRLKRPATRSSHNRLPIPITGSMVTAQKMTCAWKGLKDSLPS
jgi:hypothetical protein